MGSPKTHKVLLVDGTEARAVKLTARNHLTVLNWAPPGSEFRSQVAAKSGQESNHRLMIPIGKRLKAAYYDDWIVKTPEGYFVVKFNQVETALFFPNAFEESKVKRAFGVWRRKIMRLSNA